MIYDSWLSCVCCDFALLVAGLRCVFNTPPTPSLEGSYGCVPTYLDEDM